jgi:tRNA nucleotidyltransferase/poly(A) polymerase
LLVEIYQYPHLVKELPAEIKQVFDAFVANSLNILKVEDTIRLVGGCVRDLILGREVNDFDFATKFKPEQIF